MSGTQVGWVPYHLRDISTCVELHTSKWAHLTKENKMSFALMRAFLSINSIFFKKMY